MCCMWVLCNVPGYTGPYVSHLQAAGEAFHGHKGSEPLLGNVRRKQDGDTQACLGATWNRHAADNKIHESAAHQARSLLKGVGKHAGERVPVVRCCVEAQTRRTRPTYKEITQIHKHIQMQKCRASS